MAARPRSFTTAMTALRQRLREGRYPPGARITAADLGDELGLSATPVREALSRLAGEGLLEERRGQGYFVRLPAPEDVADLYRLSLAHLLMALEPRRDRAEPADPETATGDAVADVEALFMRWVLETGSRTLVRAQGLVQIQLGPLRRLEPGVLGDLDREARLLCAADGREARLRGVQQFHLRRIGRARDLAQAWAGRSEGAGI